MEATTELLLKLMGRSEGDYHEFRFNQGVAFLDAYLPTACNEDKQLLLESKYYWKWWNNQWNRRNEILVHEMSLADYESLAGDELVADMVIIEFLQAHSLPALNIYPNRVVIDKTYAAMASEFINDKNN